MRSQRRILAQSPIGFEDVLVQQVSAILNTTMASLFLLFQQLKKHHWMVSGTEHYSLHKLIDTWAERALKDADHVAERIVTVGGTPLDNPKGMEQAAVFQLEATPSVREMLANDLAAEQVLIRKLREQIRFLNDIGDFASEDLLRQILMAHEDQAKNIALFLEEEGLGYALLQTRKTQKQSV